jgi:MFS transporter, DHA1 family, inner membrane transport protein
MLHVAFTQNRAVNLLNLHYGLRAVAIAGGGAFFVPYLLKAGVPVPGILVALASVLMGRYALRPSVVGLAERWGLRRLVLTGTVVSALQYLLVAEVQGVGAALAALVVLTAIGDMFYWTCYHAYFAAVGDNEHRGHQLGAREAIAAIVGMASPVVAGLLLAAFNPRVAFGTTALIAGLAALPLLATPDTAIARVAPGTVAASRQSIIVFGADGWFTTCYSIVWQIALFLVLKESYVAYGGALALAALGGALGGLVLGRLIDGGQGSRAVSIAVLTLAAILGMRALATGHGGFAVAANALGAFGSCLYTTTLMTAIYTQAKQSPCPLRFHVATEGGWDIGGAGGLLAAAFIIWLGAPLWAGVLLGAAGLAVVYVSLRDYYVEAAIAAAAAAQ